MASIDLSPFVDAVQERAERLRRHAEKQKVFGWFCTYTPIELIHAAGFLPVRIYGGATPIKLASTLVPDFVCPYMRTSLERALRGEYKYFSGIIQGYTCDTPCGIINIWEENAGPGLFHSVPLPYNTTESAKSFYRQALTELSQKLAACGGEIDSDSLERSLNLYRDIRNCLLRLHQLRFQNRLALSASEFYTAAEAGFSMPPDVYLKHLQNLANALSDKENPKTTSIPVIVSGSLLEDTAVFDLIESAGGKVVADDLCNGYRFCYPADGAGADPIERLIDRYMHRFPCPTRSVVGDRVNRVKELIQQSGAAGAIFLFQKFCTPHLADYPAMAEELKKDSIPVLQVETDETVSNRGQLKTRFEAFFEMIEG